MLLGYQAIAFDFDGVLVESVDVKTRAFADLYRPYGENIVQQVVSYHLAHGGVSRFEKFRHYHSNFLKVTLGEAEEKRLGEKFSALVEDAVVDAPMVSGSSDFLKAYFGRLPMFIVSGTPNSELQRIVDRRGLRPFFKAVYGSPCTKCELLQTIAKQERILSKEILMVGDAMTDYDGANQAGTAFVGRVAPGASNPFPQNTSVIPDLTKLEGML